MNYESTLNNIRELKNYLAALHYRIMTNSQYGIIDPQMVVKLDKIEQDLVTEIYGKTHTTNDKKARNTLLKAIKQVDFKRDVLKGMYYQDGKQIFTDAHRLFILDKHIEDLPSSPAMESKRTYPDVFRIIPKEEQLHNEHKFTKEEIQNIIRKYKTIKKEGGVKIFTFYRDEELKQYGIDFDHAKVSFNGDYVVDAINVLGMEDLSIQFNKGNLRPTILRSPKGLAVIAPIREYN